VKDSNSIFQITLLKAIIVIYFLFIILNSLGSSVSFFHDNAEFGIWAIISFFMISGFILFVDIAIILLVTKAFKDKNKRVYIFIFQSIICVVVYFGLNYMFKNADKWNESAINVNQTLQTDSADKLLNDIILNTNHNTTNIY
jgi:predicted permease